MTKLIYFLKCLKILELSTVLYTRSKSHLIIIYVLVPNIYYLVSCRIVQKAPFA